MAPEDIHQQIVESSLDGLWVIDARGRTVFANRRVAELLGRTEEDVARLAVADVVAEDERACLEAHLAALARRGPERRSVERTYLRPDGTPVPLVVSESAVHDAEGRLVGYLHRLTDDTPRRALGTELS